MHLYSLAVRVYNVSEWTLRYLGEKKPQLEGELLFREKTKRGKTGREKVSGGSLLAVVLAQYVATITEPDERCRW